MLNVMIFVQSIIYILDVSAHFMAHGAGFMLAEDVAQWTQVRRAKSDGAIRGPIGDSTTRLIYPESFLVR